MSEFYSLIYFKKRKFIFYDRRCLAKKAVIMRITQFILTVATSLFGMLVALPAMAAPCNIPNTIANGQVADATKLMDNFDAVADCAEAAVTATGTPATGSIAVFFPTRRLWPQET